MGRVISTSDGLSVLAVRHHRLHALVLISAVIPWAVFTPLTYSTAPHLGLSRSRFS